MNEQIYGLMINMTNDLERRLLKS